MTAGVRIWLVRHGESTWNRERRLQGQTMDVPLTPLGRVQAVEAAAQLPAGVRLISSDQLRALDTAQIIADHLGGKVEVDARLREQGLGELEGKHYDDLAAEPTPPGQHITEVRWGGGESVQDVHARVTAFLADLATDAILVSHGDTIRILCAAIDGLGHRDVEWFDVPSAAVVGPKEFA